MNNCSNKSVAKLYERHGGGCQLVNPLYLRQNCIIWPGYGIASADSNQNLLSTLRRKGTKNCKVCWDGRFDNLAGGDCFSRVFLVTASIGCQLHHNDDKRLHNPFVWLKEWSKQSLLLLITQSRNFYPCLYKMSKEVISLTRKLRRVGSDHPS